MTPQRLNRAWRRMKRRLPTGRSWETPQPPRAWEQHGLTCPTGNPLHQPHPDPWWSGESVFASEGRKYKQPSGPFFHVAYNPTTPALAMGDHLLPPAVRHSLPPLLATLLREDGCIQCINYDVHAVYVTTGSYVFDEEHADFVIYEVEPEGRLWPDPELPVDSDSWCASRAQIVSVLAPGSKKRTGGRT